MKHRFTAIATAVAVSMSALSAPAMAYTFKDANGSAAAIPDNAPVLEQPELKVSDNDSAKKSKKPTPAEQAKQAELTSKRLDNAKKGVETAKGIVDTMNGIGKLFGFGG